MSKSSFAVIMVSTKYLLILIGKKIGYIIKWFCYTIYSKVPFGRLNAIVWRYCIICSILLSLYKLLYWFNTLPSELASNDLFAYNGKVNNIISWFYSLLNIK